ncbi:Crp/Fnr family transcriptional regulator [Anabaena catenula]|uniref:Crp/Fnr family transcriptional regulator n=1 Tax=Anabaena catenula FACHB-362 TaxID=2692877 RepID=A0ABR8J357_9NOST|nr:Crp/Fnr family transcriptional regulator [Anabaena catenula]MBD2692077.1 Crp/Fnr family transcriptional regulator [Anabaena catenula FACHB-362]
MSTQPYQQLFHVLRSLTEIPESEIYKISSIFYPVKLPVGEFFIKAGELPKTIGFVISGLLRLYYLDHSGTEFTKSFCLDNEFIAAYSALLLKEPSRLFIEALEDTNLLVADYTDYQKLAQKHICWQIVNCKLTQALFIKKEKRESELLLDDATTRYLNFLAEYPQLATRVKQYHIASYLGITTVSLSRIRAKLQKN